MKLAQEAVQKLRANPWKKYKSNKKRGEDLRKIFIETQATKEEEKGNHDIAQQIQVIRKTEHERDAYREVRNVHA